MPTVVGCDIMEAIKGDELWLEQLMNFADRRMGILVQLL
jgi:hypothetical protein